MSAVVDVVRRQGQRLRLLPVFQLPLVLRGENAGTVNVYRGDSVREVAKAHAAKMGVDDALADEVVEFVGEWGPGYWDTVPISI